MKEINLLYFPYAGGSANVCKKWEPYLSENINLVPIELPGRGNRFGETCYDNFEFVVDDVFEKVKEYISSPYALIGHSMGATFIFEIYYRIENEHLTRPLHLFFSGSKPPYTRSQTEKIYNLPQEQFWEKIISLGGTPQEVIENDELLEIFLPVLRADFKILDNYKFVPKPLKIKTDFSVLYGEDDIPLKKILEWKAHAGASVDIFRFAGGHFFIDGNIEKFTQVINKVLNKY